MSADEAQHELMQLAHDLAEDISAAAYALALTDSEDRRRETAERAAQPQDDPGPAPLAPVQFNPWSHTLANPANRTHLLGYQLQQLQHGASLSAADALAHKAVSQPGGAAPAPEREPSRHEIPPEAAGAPGLIDAPPVSGGQSQPVQGPAPRHRTRARRSRYRPLKHRAPGWGPKGQGGGYGGSTGGGGTGGDLGP